MRTGVGTFTTFAKDLLSQCQYNQSLIASIRSLSATVDDPVLQGCTYYWNVPSTHGLHALCRRLTAMINSVNVTLEQYQYQNLMDCHRRDLIRGTDWL